MEFYLNMNSLARNRSGFTRALLFILFIGLMFAVSVTNAAPLYKITATAGSHGTMDPSGIQPSGTGFYIQADPEYYIVLTFDGNVSKHSDYLYYPSPNDLSNHTLYVTFARINGSINIDSNPRGASIFIDEDPTSRGITPTTVYDVPVGPHVFRLTLPGYHDYTNDSVSVESSKTAIVPKIYLVENTTPTPTPTITPTITQPSNTPDLLGWLYSFIVPVRFAVPNPTSTNNNTNQTNKFLDSGTNNTSIIGSAGTPRSDTLANGSANITGIPYHPPAGLPPMNFPPQNVMIFLFIALIPLFLLLVHDYLGLGHLSFLQPLTVRVGVAIGQVACVIGLIFVLSFMTAQLPAFDNPLYLPLLIVLLFGAYLIFSALALAIGSLLSRPLRWTLKVHVVIGVITLLVTLISLYLLGHVDIMPFFVPIVVTIIAAPVSTLLALWQDHSLALEVHKHRFPFNFFNGDETRVSSQYEPYRRSTATRPDIFPPELADRYTSVDFVGLGGISHVFRAMRLKDGMTVAVKIPIRFDDTTGKCFLKEILAWEGLSHPNIVKIIEANILPIPFVEMEFVKSGLVDIKTPLPVRDAAEIISGVAEGLAYAHEQGIIHRDIKPHNILIDSHGVPKISDWGMSRLIGSSATQTVAGFSLAYAAPEQVSPKRFGETDERTDIYQLGVVFYELVTGKLLFPGDDLAEVSNAIISKMPVPPSEVNPLARPLDPIILKCLQKKSEDQYQSVRMLILDLNKFLGLQTDIRDYDLLFDEKGGVE